MDFQEHAYQHHQMREALVAALNERRRVEPPALQSDRHCPTGCWIHGEGARRWAGNHALLGLLEAHRAFHQQAGLVADQINRGHQQAGLVADQINRGQWSEAQKSLRNGSPFALALSDLSAALRRMRATAESLAA